WHNSDMQGFRDSFLAALPGAATGRVLQLGAGGAGAAVASALLSLGVGALELVDVDPGRAEALADRLARRFGSDRVVTAEAGALRTDRVDGIVNTTPMGMGSNPGSPLAPQLIE